MARDVADDSYYVATGGKIPVKWTAPEVYLHTSNCNIQSYLHVCILGFVISEVFCS